MSAFFLRPRFAALATAFVLSACSAASPGYIAPKSDIAPQWSALEAPKGRMAVRDDARDENWWLIFRDPQLDRLVRMALAQNHGLKAAQAAAEAANYEAGVARSALFPRLDATASAGRLRSGPFAGDTDTTARLGVQGSFDIDPAGGNRRRQEAALAEADAAVAERDRVRSAVIADVALSYIRLLSVKRQLNITQASLDEQNKHLRITRGQREEGAVSDLEVARAQAQAEGTAARLPQLKAQLASHIARLGVLSGMQTGPLNAMLQVRPEIPQVPARIAIARPVSVVRQRPDIRVAERRLARDAALREAAIAGMYPSLSLSAFYGRAHSKNAGGYSPWDIAASTLAPLIDFGRIRNQINASDARARQAMQAYEDTVLNGLAEVESNLSAYLNEQKRAEILSSAAGHERNAVQIAAAQYEGGAIGQIDLLIAESNRLQADLALALSQQAAAETLVRLFQSLGWGSLAPAPLRISPDASRPTPVPTLEEAVQKSKRPKKGMQPVMDE